MRLHIGQLAAHCQGLGLAVDAGKDFAIIWLGPRLQRRVVRRRPSIGLPNQAPTPTTSLSLSAAAAAAAAAASASSSSADAFAERDERRRRHARAPFALVAYRHGAAVLLGPPALEPGEDYEMPDIDAAALSRVMPLGAFYRTGRADDSKAAGEFGRREVCGA
jgi:hypothetical protein